MASLWGESTPKRIWEDTKSWLKNHIIAWVLAFLIPGGGSVIAILFIPPTMDLRLAALWGLIGGAGGLALLVIGTYGIQSILVFKKQRDEARKLCKPMEELVDIKKGDTIREKDINVSLMSEKLKSDYLTNVTFEHCVLRGPCTIMPRGHCEFYACNLAAGLGTTLFKAEIGKKYFGVGVFINCKFKFCDFNNLSFLLKEGEIKKFQSEVIKL